MINRKSRDEIKRMRHAGHIVALVHKKMKEVVEPGISTKELDAIAMQVIKENKAIPTFLGYGGFPACICTSVNDRVVHGIPSEKEIFLKVAGQIRDNLQKDCVNLNDCSCTFHNSEKTK